MASDGSERYLAALPVSLAFPVCSRILVYELCDLIRFASLLSLPIWSALGSSGGASELGILRPDGCSYVRHSLGEEIDLMMVVVGIALPSGIRRLSIRSWTRHALMSVGSTKNISKSVNSFIIDSKDHSSSLVFP